MNHLKLLLISIPFLITSIYLSNTEQPRRWKFIADKNVSFGPDHDVINVGGNDNYRQLKLRVTDAPLRINDMKVHFENGDVFDVSVKQEIRQGGESRVINLPGASRSIRKIEFWYSTIGVAKGRARVAVWGRR